MANKRARTTLTMGEEEDRISKLPDVLIIRILSFLGTEDVVRTCLLSKRWKLMWYLVPKLSFSHFRLPEGDQKFYTYVDNCLEHRKRGTHLIQDSLTTSFRLEMDCYKRSEADRLDNWLDFVVENKVKKINLRLNGRKRRNNGSIYFYCLPRTLIFNARHLGILKLFAVELDSRHSFSFPSLRSLSLSHVRLADDDVVDKLLLGSPSLEKLRLYYCCLSSDHQLHIHIQSLSLKFLKIKLTKDMVEQIKVINLESLKLKGVSFKKINISVCKAIRILSLNCDGWGGMEESSSLEYLISNLPLLENLTLSDCHKCRLKHIKISSQHLKSLSLSNPCDDEMTIVIESAPKLATFLYIGNIKFSISMESSNLLDGTFIILGQQENYDANWFINMMNFLFNLNCSWNRVSMHLDSLKALTLPENLKRICRSPLVNWEHLRIFTKCKPERESDLRHALQWISPSLKTLSIAKEASFKHFATSKT
ncbi:F-box/LRR-repeat protein At3g26922-like [Humulus lupulus]|uniref:F-box/LRR-repeat protein At3g26922-like n=1 Tax=Humulus lupulus TaxID=3486 RepID=UPI002B4170DD|nr:F-box/LRR-repeat protein At3g26922-like [Humulus lupulus]